MSNYRKSALSKALEKNDHKKVKQLMGDGKTPLFEWLKELNSLKDKTQASELINLIKQYGVKPKPREDYDVLIEWINKSDTSTFRKLLEIGFNLETKLPRRMTPLCHAISKKKVGKAKLLIEFGADVLAVSLPNHWTPLDFAADAGMIEIIEILIERGANPYAETGQGDMTLNNARNLETLKVLIEKGADKLPEGHTPLHVLAWCDAPARRTTPLENLVKDYQRRGIDIDLLNYRGKTPLHLAIDKYFVNRRVSIYDQFGSDRCLPCGGIKSVPHIDILLRYGANIWSVFWRDQELVAMYFTTVQYVSDQSWARQAIDVPDKLVAFDIRQGWNELIGHFMYYEGGRPERFEKQALELKATKIHRSMSHYEFLYNEDYKLTKKIYDADGPNIDETLSRFPQYDSMFKGKIKHDLYHAKVASLAKGYLRTCFAKSPDLKHLHVPEEIIDLIMLEFDTSDLYEFSPPIDTKLVCYA